MPTTDTGAADAAISLVAVPGRRRRTLDIAREIERRGFFGIYMPSRLSTAQADPP
jgi:hypothetical protein